MSVLNSIEIVLPGNDQDFFSKLAATLSSVASVTHNSIIPHSSHDRYLPSLAISTGNSDSPKVLFKIEGEEHIQLTISNDSGKEWNNTHHYQPISIEDFQERINGTALQSIDHIGFNLPWPQKEPHPKIVALRDRLKDSCLYHLFPTGENWDFIIPGTRAEIESIDNIDYSTIRKPKFEIVSFEGCSVPLIQIDTAVNVPYTKLMNMFPEAIHLDDIGSVWVYLIHNYGLDICLVLNESRGDWSEFFKNSRLK